MINKLELLRNLKQVGLCLGKVGLLFAFIIGITGRQAVGQGTSHWSFLNAWRDQRPGDRERQRPVGMVLH